MIFIIILNVSVMSINYYGIESDGGLLLTAYIYLMGLCTRVYYVECLLKLLGLTIMGYFSSAWNRFEFTLVLAAILDDYATSSVSLPLPPMLLRVLRIARRTSLRSPGPRTSARRPPRTRASLPPRPPRPRGSRRRSARHACLACSRVTELEFVRCGEFSGRRTFLFRSRHTQHGMDSSGL